MAFPLPQAAPARRVRLPGARRRRERAYRRGRRERCPHRPGRGGLAAAGGQAGRRIAAWPVPHRGDHRARGRPRSGAGEAARQHRLRALLSQEDDAGVRGPRAALAGRARRRRRFDGVRVTALGDRIRALRNERELQQRQLAEKAELTPSMVSQIESGRLTPSLNTLGKIAAALGVPIATLFDGAPAGRIQVTRKKDYPVVSFDGSSEKWTVLGAGLFEGKIRAVVSTLDARAKGVKTEKVLIKLGQMKLFYVLDGEVGLHYNGERHTLETGDSALLDGGLPHGWENLGTRKARVLWVILG